MYFHYFHVFLCHSTTQPYFDLNKHIEIASNYWIPLRRSFLILHSCPLFTIAPRELLSARTRSGDDDASAGRQWRPAAKRGGQHGGGASVCQGRSTPQKAQQCAGGCTVFGCNRCLMVSRLCPVGSTERLLLAWHLLLLAFCYY